jgi:hypothetical protein
VLLGLLQPARLRPSALLSLYHAPKSAQQAVMIRYTRGHIEAIDQEGLEGAACSCYRLIADQYMRLLEHN